MDLIIDMNPNSISIMQVIVLNTLQIFGSNAYIETGRRKRNHKSKETYMLFNHLGRGDHQVNNLLCTHSAGHEDETTMTGKLIFAFLTGKVFCREITSNQGDVLLLSQS